MFKNIARPKRPEYNFVSRIEFGLMYMQIELKHADRFTFDKFGKLDLENTRRLTYESHISAYFHYNICFDLLEYILFLLCFGTSLVKIVYRVY